MAKEKQTRRMIAMALAAAVTVTAVPVDALAASDYSNKVARMQAKNEARKEAAAQKMGRVTVTLEEEVAAEEVVEEAVEEIAAADEQQEAPEVTVKTEGTADAETGVVGDNGSMETTTVTPVTDANGKVVGDITVVEGESVTTTEKEGPMNEVTVPVIGEGVEPDHYDEDGNPVYKNTDEDSLPDPEVSGDVQEGEDDKEYDYLTKEETPREVEVTITGSEISYDQDKDAYEGEQDLEFMTPIWDGTQKNLGGGTLDWFPGNPLEQTVDGYDYTPYGFMHNDVTHMYYIRTNKDGGMVDNSGKAVYYYDAETDTYSRTIPKDVVLYDIAYQNIKPLYYQAEDGSFELIDGNDEKGVAKIESVVFQSNSMMVAFYDKSQTHSQEMWDAVYDDLMAMGTNPSTAVAKEFYAKHPEFLDIIDISRLVDDYQDGEVTEETKKLYNTIFALWEKEKALLQFEAPNNIIPAYCVDVNTGTIRGAWYELMNVEDAGYYSTERTEENGYISDSDRIKAIALHGYWGTAEGETGSLTAMKEFLQGRLDEATEKGETLCFTQADIDGLTHGCALSVTQHSLWRFGNSLDGAIMDAYTYTYSNREERNARIERLIEYFTTMPVDTKEFDEHEIITQ
ncbi:MAG: Cys-Gln thioester bond-forming surface protein, partial [Anaerotignum sp.]|nr:Cys-Gln thioester bond-forming surface protein [Anaerotignum sp.]